MYLGTDNNRQISWFPLLRAPIIPLLIFLSIPFSARGQVAEVKFKGYAYLIVMRDVRNVHCKYGHYELTIAATRSSGKTIESGKASFPDGVISPTLTCQWESDDGTPRAESIDMNGLISDRTIKFNFSDVEPYLHQLLLFDPDIQVELEKNVFRIAIVAKIQYYGEQVAPSTRRLLYREVRNVLVERNWSLP